MFTYNCHWLPCMDALKYRCAYTLQLGVPHDYTAICNGELKTKSSNVSSSKSYFVYDIKKPILARNLTFAIGPFIEISLNDILPSFATDLSLTPNNQNEEEEDDDDDDEQEEQENKSEKEEEEKEENDKTTKKTKNSDKEENDDSEDDDIDIDGDDESEDQDEDMSSIKDEFMSSLGDDFVKIKLYVLQDNMDNIITSCFNIPRMIKTYEKRLNLSFPYKSLSFVFVDESYDLGLSYMNLNILSNDLLHTELQIEQSYETNDIISRCIADNWMNYSLDVSKIEDLWIKIGFAGLLHYEWLTIYEGKNEMEYRKAMWRAHREETGPHPHQHPKPPLSWNGYLHEEQLFILYYDYIKEKSMYVIKMLQQLLGSQSFDRNVTKNIIYGYKNGKFLNKYGTIITSDKLQNHLCGIFSAKQIEKFFHDFVYGDACPKICAEYSYRKKDNRHILCLKQEHVDNSYCNVIGTLKLQIQELDHETIEYVQIPCNKQDVLKFEFVCQSKAKRKHKNANDNEPWLESPANNDTPTKWVRIDPDYEWLLHLSYFIMDHRIAITQLLHDDIRNVKSQIEAIHSLRIVPSKDVSEALLQTLNDEMNFYKVRLQAAKALAEDRNPETLHENKRLLIDIINKLWNQIKTGNKTNNNNSGGNYKKIKQKITTSTTNGMNNNNNNNNKKSQELINYFLIKNITCYLSNLSEHKHPHNTPIEIVDLITTLLKELIDDNVEIAFCQESLTASMILNLGNIRIDQYARKQKISQIAQTLSTILSLQRLFTSHRGIIHSACLKTYSRLFVNHPDHEQLKQVVIRCRKFAKYGKWHDQVRIDAFEAQLKILTDCKKSFKRCLKLIAQERVPGVRIKMIELWIKHNKEKDYFTNYENDADQQHRHKKQSQSLDINNNNDNNGHFDDDEPAREEKLDAINLRPTLRGYRSKVFMKKTKTNKNNNNNNNKHKPRPEINEWSFINKVLRNENSNYNQTYIAESIWYLLLRSFDKNQSDKYKQILHEKYTKNGSKNKILEDPTMISSIDLMFVLYELYKSIWGFSQPPFYKNEKGLIALQDYVGNQKRVRDACQQIRAKFNNNSPQFLSVGAQLWKQHY